MSNLPLNCLYREEMSTCFEKQSEFSASSEVSFAINVDSDEIFLNVRESTYASQKTDDFLTGNRDANALLLKEWNSQFQNITTDLFRYIFLCERCRFQSSVRVLETPSLYSSVMQTYSKVYLLSHCQKSMYFNSSTAKDQKWFLFRESLSVPHGGNEPKIVRIYSIQFLLSRLHAFLFSWHCRSLRDYGLLGEYGNSPTSWSSKNFLTLWSNIVFFFRCQNHFIRRFFSVVFSDVDRRFKRSASHLATRCLSEALFTDFRGGVDLSIVNRFTTTASSSGLPLLGINEDIERLTAAAAAPCSTRNEINNSYSTLFCSRSGSWTTCAEAICSVMLSNISLLCDAFLGKENAIVKPADISLIMRTLVTCCRSSLSPESARVRSSLTSIVSKVAAETRVNVYPHIISLVASKVCDGAVKEKILSLYGAGRIPQDEISKEQNNSSSGLSFYTTLSILKELMCNLEGIQRRLKNLTVCEDNSKNSLHTISSFPELKIFNKELRHDTEGAVLSSLMGLVLSETCIGCSDFFSCSATVAFVAECLGKVTEKTDKINTVNCASEVYNLDVSYAEEALHLLVDLAKQHNHLLSCFCTCFENAVKTWLFVLADADLTELLTPGLVEITASTVQRSAEFYSQDTLNNRLSNNSDFAARRINQDIALCGGIVNLIREFRVAIRNIGESKGTVISNLLSGALLRGATEFMRLNAGLVECAMTRTIRNEILNALIIYYDRQIPGNSTGAKTELCCDERETGFFTPPSNPVDSHLFRSLKQTSINECHRCTLISSFLHNVFSAALDAAELMLYIPEDSESHVMDALYRHLITDCLEMFIFSDDRPLKNVSSDKISSDSQLPVGIYCQFPMMLRNCDEFVNGFTLASVRKSCSLMSGKFLDATNAVLNVYNQCKLSDLSKAGEEMVLTAFHDTCLLFSESFSVYSICNNDELEHDRCQCTHRSTVIPRVIPNTQQILAAMRDIRSVIERFASQREKYMQWVEDEASSDSLGEKNKEDQTFGGCLKVSACSVVNVMVLCHHRWHAACNSTRLVCSREVFSSSGPLASKLIKMSDSVNSQVRGRNAKDKLSKSAGSEEESGRTCKVKLTWPMQLGEVFIVCNFGEDENNDVTGSRRKKSIELVTNPCFVHTLDFIPISYDKRSKSGINSSDSLGSLVNIALHANTAVPFAMSLWFILSAARCGLFTVTGCEDVLSDSVSSLCERDVYMSDGSYCCYERIILKLPIWACRRLSKLKCCAPDSASFARSLARILSVVTPLISGSFVTTLSGEQMLDFSASAFTHGRSLASLDEILSAETSYCDGRNNMPRDASDSNINNFHTPVTNSVQIKVCKFASNPVISSFIEAYVVQVLKRKRYCSHADLHAAISRIFMEGKQVGGRAFKLCIESLVSKGIIRRCTEEEEDEEIKKCTSGDAPVGAQSIFYHYRD